ncbi:MAG: hypothetical protein IIA66_00640 [Planctomycetes bacterium]|nr:hypothetical protein [Planctomycetota bacterium]
MEQSEINSALTALRMKLAILAGRIKDLNAALEPLEQKALAARGEVRVRKAIFAQARQIIERREPQ